MADVDMEMIFLTEAKAEENTSVWPSYPVSVVRR